ncbi:Eco29kI family restriction endonuclease [Kitasatospora sp. NPDC096147]|uniref:Eco29kI family restriction endonuclease n=1 Tax=Kitasatospora sp. NPDC096147 TaxID=3364093 RepID=UPI00381729AA
MTTQPAFDGFAEGSVAGPEIIYDPLRRENIGRSVLWALTSRDAVQLDRVPRFNGCGIYALYYAGDHELYGPISSDQFEVPIYVGKADPSGGRKGVTVGEAWEGNPLWSRLGNHSRKIDKASDLNVQDFFARYLPADDLFTPMAERLMIRDLRPVWNVVLEGFGVNRQGSGREGKQLRPKWHEVHTGVDWADGMTAQPGGPEPLRQQVRAHLELYGQPHPGAAGRPPGVI